MSNGDLSDDDFRERPDPKRQLALAAAGRLATRRDRGPGSMSHGVEHNLIAACPVALVVPQSVSVRRSWTLRIDGWHPAPLNTLTKHWTAAHRAKRADREVVAEALLLTTAAGAQKKRRVSLVVVWPPKVRRRDPDAYWKSLLDALVAGGALKNDSSEWVELGTVEQPRGDRLTTFVTIEEL